MATENTDLREERNYIIFKGRFKSNSLTLYGLFLIIFNQERHVDNHSIVVSTYSNVYDLETHTAWNKYEEAIQDLKWKGNINNSMSSSLMDQIGRIINENSLRNQLYDYLNEYNYEGADIMMFDAINRIINDKGLLLETGIQEITPEELRESRERKVASDEKIQETSIKGVIDEGSVILSIEPILAPVKGKPIYELKIGDRIMAKITPNTDRSNYFIDLLGLRLENHIKPVPCEVVDIKAPSKSDPIEIITEIGPGIYGKCIEDERQVKLRIYNPAIDGPLAKKVEGKKKAKQPDIKVQTGEPGLSRMTYILMGLFAILLVIFMLLIYLSL